MKKILFILTCFFLTIPLFSSEKIVVFNLNDGIRKTYNIKDIESMDIVKNTIDNLMLIYSQNQEVVYYPVNSIDSIRFEQTANSTDSMLIYLFGAPRKISIEDIDSICFQKLETKLNNDVFVFDSSANKEILLIDSTRLVINDNSLLVNNLTVGKIITSEPTEITPYGFLRRVVSVSNEGNSIIIETENANLTDVVESGIVSFQREFSPADTGKITVYIKDDNIQANEGFTIGFTDIVIFDYDKNTKTTNDQIKIDGTNTFNPAIGFNLVIENWQVKQVLLQLNVQNHLELTAHANFSYTQEIQKSLNELLGIPKIKLPNITIWLGWFPFVITSNIDVQVGAELSIGAEVSSGISTDASACAGVEYNSGNIKPVSSFSSNFNFNPPELSLGGSVKGFVGPQINVNFYNIPEAFNAYAGVFGFLELEVSLLSKPLWQLWAGVEATTGIESEWFNIDYTLPVVLEYRKLLAQANDLVESVTPTQGKIGDTVTITGSGFGDLRGSNYVGFKRNNSLLNVIQATDYIDWTDEEIQVKIPNGLSAGTGKLILNLGGFLGNMVDFNIIEEPRITSINPNSASEEQLVIISGTNFGTSRQTSFVRFNQTDATNYDSWSNTSIRVKVPKGATTGKLSVTVNAMKSNEVDFTVKPISAIADTVKIGTQVWMTKNLDVVKYRNGDPIPQVQDNKQWKDLKTGAWCYYNNDSTQGKVYGKLYNWYAVNDSRGLAPEGWSIPSESQWVTLANYLGGISVAGGKIKESGFDHWLIPNTGATNESGFTALPGGYRRNNNGTFSSLGNLGYWWTSTEANSTYAKYKGLSNQNSQVTSSDYSKANGFSVRCMR